MCTGIHIYYCIIYNDHDNLNNIQCLLWIDITRVVGPGHKPSSTIIIVVPRRQQYSYLYIMLYKTDFNFHTRILPRVKQKSNVGIGNIYRSDIYCGSRTIYYYDGKYESYQHLYNIMYIIVKEGTSAEQYEKKKSNEFNKEK